jgi:DNA invertase Pin-like site-specific DNA recombinase
MNGSSIHSLNLRVVFYARVSTDKYEQLHSLKSQISFFHDYISKIPNWKFITSYIDEGISGTQVKKREEFLHMINDAKNNLFDLILTKEISRFSRNTLDSIKYTQELLSYGVGVYFLNDNINTILPDSELRLTIMSSIAQDEVRRLSERVSFGMKRSIDNGIVLGNSNIYGYTKNNGKLIIDEKEARMIKIIFDRYANTSDGLTKISSYLYNLGYKSKTLKKFDTTVLTRIIENPKYKGYYCGCKSKVIDYRTKAKKLLDKSNWIIYQDNSNVPPIVTEELWERANKKLKIRHDSFKNKILNKKIFQNRYTYSSKIYCKSHLLTYHRVSSGKRKNNPVWECQIYRRESLKGCTNPRIFEVYLDDLFYKILTKYINNTILINECKKYLETNNSNKDIEKIKSKKEKLLNLLLEEYISKEDYKTELDKIEYDINELNKYNNISIETIIEKLDKCLDNKQCFNNIFNELVENIYVSKIDNKNIKLDILLYNGNYLYASSDDLGKKFHLLDINTTSNGSICCS